jgi:hypothetical protein
MERVFTNGAYDVKGQLIDHNIVGVIIKSKYPQTYAVGRKVVWPEYHCTNDKKPQFVDLRVLKLKKLKKLSK